MIEILHKTEAKVFSFANKQVLKMQIDNFRVKSKNRLFALLVNNALQKQEYQFLKNVYANLYPEAVKTLKKSEINNFFFAPYEAILTYQVSLNQDCVLSFFYDNYTFTGGAHGITFRKAQTYSFKNREQMTLWSFFKNKQEAQEVILSEISKQAEINFQENEGIYFDNYQTLIRKNFNPENFFLTPKGMTIFFNQYEIAPYSTGIVEFSSPYSKIDFPPVC